MKKLAFFALLILNLASAQESPVERSTVLERNTVKLNQEAVKLRTNIKGNTGVRGSGITNDASSTGNVQIVPSESDLLSSCCILKDDVLAPFPNCRAEFKDRIIQLYPSMFVPNGFNYQSTCQQNPKCTYTTPPCKVACDKINGCKVSI